MKNNIFIEKLTDLDLQRLDDLGRPHRNTLGFLTTESLKEYLQKGGVFGAITDTGILVGYLLFADYPDRFRIAQLCVKDEFRKQGIARLLVDSLKSIKTTQKVIKLRCRRDFPAHEMWKKLGFIPVNEKQGRSAEGLPLTTFYLKLAHDDELGLWRASTSESIIDAVIDAQILFDLHAEETTNSLISKGLFNDFLGDSLKLWITDEMFLEINRQSNSVKRQQSLKVAQGMDRIPYNQDLAEKYIAILKEKLPCNTDSAKSDIHHLAKTAASDIHLFVTKDEKILKNAEIIKSLTGVNVVHPSKIITQIHEKFNQESYFPLNINGLNLSWQRMRDDDCHKISTSSFQKKDESKGQLIATIRSYLSHPDKYQCEILRNQQSIVAIRIIDISDASCVTIPFARTECTYDGKVFGVFLVADSLSLAIHKNLGMVKFHGDGIHESMTPVLLNTGFKKFQSDWIRFAIARVYDKSAVVSYIGKKFPNEILEYQRMEHTALEDMCAPLVLNENTPTFIIPIRPAFAMGLIDNRRAADDLFGGDTPVLLRWDNVYFRAKTCHKMLGAPGRILWYVSGKNGEIIAISHLDEVSVGFPKDLFRKYQKFGVLVWRDIFEICKKRVDIEIMALRFSQTFLFKNPIPFAKVQKIAKENGISLSLQSPQKVSFSVLKSIYETGFQNNYE